MKLNAKQGGPLKWMKGLMLVVCTVFMLTSCNNDDADFEPEEVALVSIYNASPNSPALDIGIDNRQLNIYPFDYTDYTGYLRFFTGSRNISFTPANANNVVVDTAFQFVANRAYSLFAVDDYEDLKVLRLEDSSDSPSEGKAKIRFIHLSPDAPGLQLSADDQNSNIVDETAFLDASSFVEVDANSYSFMITSPNDANIDLSIPNVSLQQGYYYTVLVRGYNTPPNGNNNVLSAEIIVN